MEAPHDPDPLHHLDVCLPHDTNAEVQAGSSGLFLPSTTLAPGDPMLSGNGSEIRGPGSSCDSHTNPETSTAPSLTCLSLEERLRRLRAAEELKQQQRLAAYLESQRQAELSRLKAQEDRKRKLEELHQRAEARRQLVLERRKELERSSKAKIEMLRDRSNTRQFEHRRHADLPGSSGRTASASPSLDTARNPSRLMTTSCVVAFGSSAPRSMCTQLSQTALRLQHAFEARIANYLTGRHSGCYLTPSASPQILRLIPNERLSLTPSAVAFSQRHVAMSKRSHRRSVSAHASLLQPTKASLARSHHTKHVPEPDIANIPAKVHPEAGSRSAKQVTLASPISSSTTNEVTYDRCNSSHDFHTLGRIRAPHGMTSNARSTKPATRAVADASSAPHSTTASVASSYAGSHRSSSMDALAKRAQSNHVPSVFERLAAPATSRNRPATVDSSDVRPKFAIPSRTVKKVAPNGPMPATKHPLVPSSRTLPRGMSASVYVDRKTTAAKNQSTVLRKRSVSPKQSSTIQPPEHSPNGAYSPTPSEPTVISNAKGSEAVVEPVQIAEARGPDIDISGVVVPPGSDSEVHIIDVPAPSKEFDATVVTTPVTPSEYSQQVLESSTDGISALAHSIPLKAETKGAGEGALLSENEAAIYRAKLFEQRRLAKERKEQEQRRLEEEQRRRQSQLDAERLAAQQAALEQAERLAQEEANAQRLREEEEKARLRAIEAERLAKLQRAEEERVMRKKRLDSIMSRVKSSTGNGKPSDHLLSNVSSVPLLQDCVNTDDSVAIKSDVSDPVLSLHAVPRSKDFEQSLDTANSSHVLVDGTDDHVIPLTEEKQKDPPISFSLPVERNGVPNGHDNLNHMKSDFAECNGADTEVTSETPASPQSHHQPSSNRPTSVPNSPVKSLLSLSTTPPVQPNIDGNATVPRFKSALLQSMLGGGRLATHAKDAVVGLRSRGSSSQLLDCASKTDDESGMNSPPQWTRITPSGDVAANVDILHSTSPPRVEPMTCGRQADLTRSSPMVQSMFEGPVDSFRVNCSNETPRSVGSPILPLAQHQD